MIDPSAGTGVDGPTFAMKSGCCWIIPLAADFSAEGMGITLGLRMCACNSGILALTATYFCPLSPVCPLAVLSLKRGESFSTFKTIA